MGLQRKTNNASQEFKALCSSLNMRMFGFSLTFAWSFLVFYGPFWSETAPYASNTAVVFSFSCCMGNIFGYLLTRLVNRRRNYLDRTTPVNIAVLVATIVGMLVAVSSFAAPHDLQELFTVCGGVISGLTTSWITVMWGSFFVSLRLAQRTICILSSVVAGGALYLGIMLFPSWAQLVIACLILPLSWLLANSCNAGKGPVGKESADSYRKMKLETRSSVFAMFLFGIFFWICRTIKTAHTVPSYFDTLLFVAVYLVVIALVAWVILISRRQITAEVIFRFALPAAMLGVILIFCLDNQYESLGFSLFMSAYALMDVFLLLVLCNSSRRTRCDPIKGICFGRLPESLSMPLGMLLGFIFLRFDLAMSESTLALGIVFLIAVSISSIPSQNSAQSNDLIEHEEAESNVASVSSALEFAQKCRLASESYGLSPRETEVMLLITRGRSVPYISDNLYMARSTTKAHVTSIYRKMDVRDRQEMIDLIESIPVE